MRALLACLIVAAILPAAASARPGSPAPPPRLAGERIVGAPTVAAKAAGDTILLLGPNGSGAPALGDFETAGGAAAWNGWTSVDNTADQHLAWHVDTFHAVSGTYSAWCGDPGIPSCGQPWDEPGGYGNNWAEYLEWRGTVADSTLSCTVTVSAVANHDTEPGYDFCYVNVEKRGQAFTELWVGDGNETGVAISGSTLYAPGDYVGDGNDEVRVVFRFLSDGAFSAEDCLWPNEGAIQLDDVVITLSNGTGYGHDFEDGTLGEFAVVTPPGVGDFAQLWIGLPDLDPCRENVTPQVAFIDDGLVVPGTGGSNCITWCYGPGNYVVNTTGGLSEPGPPYWPWETELTLNNTVVSPPLAWADSTHDGALLSFDVYRHEELAAESPGVFFVWYVRSVATGVPDDLARARWTSRRFLYYEGPSYTRMREVLDDLLVPGRTHVQVALGALEYGWNWGWVGNDASPAPYFDNVRLETYRATGPYLAAEAADLAADAYPRSGAVDLVDLGTNGVPFGSTHLPFGGTAPDSLVITCAPVRTGAVLTEPPQFHYKRHRNPLFDLWRTSPLADEGTIPCVSAEGRGEDMWAVDLPDEGFLFPGDRLHCYFTATEDPGGDPTTVMLPADTTGFSSFADYPLFDGGYDQAFAMRALPTIRESVTSPGTYETNDILLWHDSATANDWPAWTRALHESGLLAEQAVDVFHTQNHTAGQTGGLGSRATTSQLGVYATVVYTSGEASLVTLEDPDALRLDEWLRSGGRNLLAFGNDLASDLAAGVPSQAAFLADWFGCSVEGRDIRPLIGNQTSPLVRVEAGNPVLVSASSWTAYGAGCSSSPLTEGYSTLVRDRFDAVTAGAGDVRLASWAVPGGGPGSYPQAAALLREVPAFTAVVILVPVDFPLIRNDPQESGGASVSPSARSRLLTDVLNYFGHATPGTVTPVPPAAVFAVSQHPNPFNPATTIAYTAPQPGRLTVKVYDVRGRLVRTVWDAPVVEDGAVVWDGTRDGGAAAPSGVYFYEARLGGDVQVGKMALLK